MEASYRELIEWIPAVVYEADVGGGSWHYVSPYVERLSWVAAAT